MKALVVYFSASGITRQVAGTLADERGIALERRDGG